MFAKVLKLLTLVALTFAKDDKEKYMDKSVDPCDNFYDYACGNFKNYHPLVNGEEMEGHFKILQNEIDTKIITILEANASEDEPKSVQKAKIFYKTCKDLQYLDALEANPLLNLIDALGGWPVISTEVNEGEKLTWDQLGSIMAEYGLPFFFDMAVVPSPFSDSRYTILIDQDYVSNPEAGISPNGRDSAMKSDGFDKYHQYLRELALHITRLRGDYIPTELIDERIAANIEFMKTIQAGGVIPPGSNISYVGPENEIRFLQNWTDAHFGKDYGLNWNSYIKNVFKLSNTTIHNLTYTWEADLYGLYGMLTLFKMADADAVRNYVIARVLLQYGAELNSYVVGLMVKYDFYRYERSQYCLEKTLGHPYSIGFSFAATHAYLERYYIKEKLKEAKKIADNLWDVYYNLLDEAPWMDDESTKKAKSKLDSLGQALGYNSTFDDAAKLDDYYKNFQVCSSDPVGNAKRMKAFNKAKSFKELDNGKNNVLFDRSPLWANAGYNRALNRMLIPLALLHRVFFEGKNGLLDYARLGSIVGHEMTHGFDDQGRLYDDWGTLGYAWWSNDTIDGFEELSECYVEQYGQYRIEEIDVNVDGKRTLNENLADNSGIYAAYRAAKMAGRKGRSDERWSDDQLFFLGYASMWCVNQNKDYIDRVFKSGAYAPEKYRVIGTLSNYKEFADAFSCKAGDRMNPVKKCGFWRT